MKVVTRFPPSPTGNLHIGGARTALFNYLFTKHHGGKMHLRLENTDEDRSKPEFEKNILDSLSWLGLSFDPIGSKPFWRQSERKDIYQSHLRKLVEKGSAYISKETNLPSQAGGNLTKATRATYGVRREEVVRFRNPNKEIAFDDLIRGRIKFDTAELGDMVIAKSLEEPLYHLAVVIDDHEMGVTHVIRGEDHISNTPRQILLQEALQFDRPQYAHIPLILAPDRSKLSKRHGAVSVTEYRDNGYIPEAFLNYLALLGWNPGTEQEIFSLAELVEVFDFSKVQKGGAIFSEEKLRWMNREYLKKGGVEALLPHLPRELTEGKTETQIHAIAEMLLNRVTVSGGIRSELASGELDFLLTEPKYSKELLKWTKATTDPAPHLREILSLLKSLQKERFTKTAITDAVISYAQAQGKGNVLWPMRVALSGKEQSTDPFTLSAMIGKETTLKRLKQALSYLR